MSENDFQVHRTFFGGTVPGMQVNASNGAIVKVVFNIVMQQREEDTLRKFANWIEEGGQERMDDQDFASKVFAEGQETITVNPEGLGQVTICCESGSQVEINFNTKTFHFHQAKFKTDEIIDIINDKKVV